MGRFMLFYKGIRIWGCSGGGPKRVPNRGILGSFWGPSRGSFLTPFWSLLGHLAVILIGVRIWGSPGMTPKWVQNRVILGVPRGGGVDFGCILVPPYFGGGFWGSILGVILGVVLGPLFGAFWAKCVLYCVGSGSEGLPGGVPK